MQKSEQEPQELLQISYTWQKTMGKEMHKWNIKIKDSSLQADVDAQ